MNRIVTCIVAAALAMALVANSDPRVDDEPSEFVGRYNGNSFETAMGMEILPDGTWRWGVSVGALDMRAQGSWEQRGDRLFLTSDPKPVEPRFDWSGLEPSDSSVEDAPFLRIVWGSNGKAFRFGSAQVTCRNGRTFYGQVRADGYPSTAALEFEDPLPADQDPRQSCDTPEKVVLTQGVYSVRSEEFDLSALGWKPGQTARFVFHRNDMGVADFTGVSGVLEDNTLKLSGAQWPLELRKIPAKPTTALGSGGQTREK